MKVFESVVDTIGNTPMIKMKKVSAEIGCKVYAKVEYFNPGNSVKDRMAKKLILDAIENKKIKKGGTFIESTSGNTGMGLAIVCNSLGYKLICTTSEKQSKEKVDILQAMGAKVIICPDVEPDNPKSYYNVAKKIEKQTPNSYYLNQYNNISNRNAHYESTGPEIWEQTEGKITHFIVGAGTGGTISGVGRFLKEKNKKIKIWGVDTYGSVLKKYHETGVFDKKEIYPYITEGIGEDIIPKNYDFSVIDLLEKVKDKDGAIYSRILAKKESIFSGYSAGSSLAALYQLKNKLNKNSVVVILFHDHGSRYIGKIYNDNWMKKNGWI